MSWFLSSLSPYEQRKHALIQSGVQLVDLSMINPDLPPPRFMLDRLLEASFKEVNHRYAVARGVRKLREAFSQKYANTFGLHFDAEEEICVTSGAKDAINLALCTLRIQGTVSNQEVASSFASEMVRASAVLLPAPTYPSFLHAVEFAGLKPIFYQVKSDEKHTLESIADTLAICHKHATEVRAVIVNFPNNPTGTGVSPLFFQRLWELTAPLKITVINDFVYGELGFKDPVQPSLFSCKGFRQLGVEVYSLSKGYSVPGWRVAAAVGDAAIIKQIAQLRSRTDYGLFLPIQSAAASTLVATDDFVAPIRREYERRAWAMTTVLLNRGWKLTEPVAGASLWAEAPDALIEAATLKELSLAELLLERGIACAPGEQFGADFKNYVRFALIVPAERLLALEGQL